MSRAIQNHGKKQQGIAHRRAAPAGAAGGYFLAGSGSDGPAGVDPGPGRRLAGIQIRAAGPARNHRPHPGPEGSSYQNNAQKYKKIIERNGISVHILTSHGALENLQRLADPGFRVDVGFVQGGLKDDLNTEHLRSLGSIQTQPLLVFYRGDAPVSKLSQFRGKRLAIGPEGSGTRFLALKLLKANSIDTPPTVQLDIGGQDAAKALTERKADAAFLMGDSATPAIMRGLLQAPGIRVMNFEQAEGYTRRLHFLSKLLLPKGAIDLGKNLPAEDLNLIGPTVELVAREDLHPALSDMLINAAREVHGGPGMFRDAGEFPAPLERDFPISDDAERYYKSGTQFLYSRLPFWLASLVDRMLVILLPLLVLIVPASRLVPTLFAGGYAHASTGGMAP